MIIRFSKFLFVLLVVAGLSACAKSPEQESKAAIKDMISLLESGKAREFMDQYANPGMVKTMKAAGMYDRAVSNISKNRMQAMVKSLKSMLESKPEISKDGMTAVYKDGRRKVTFKKIENRWYLMK